MESKNEDRDYRDRSNTAFCVESARRTSCCVFNLLVDTQRAACCVRRRPDTGCDLSRQAYRVPTRLYLNRLD